MQSSRFLLLACAATAILVPQLSRGQSPAPGHRPPPAADPALIEKARDAMRQKMSEIEGRPAAPATQPIARPAAPAAPAAMPSAQPGGSYTPYSPEANAQNDAAIEQARNAAEKERAAAEKIAVRDSQKAQQTLDANSQGTYAPLPVPPNGVASSKAQQLQQLLNDYKADRLSPAQYHEQRAKILAEP